MPSIGRDSSSFSVSVVRSFIARFPLSVDSRKLVVETIVAYPRGVSGNGERIHWPGRATAAARRRGDTPEDRGAPPIDPKLTILTLGVRDLAATRRFYVDGLGWRPTAEVEGEVIFIQVAGGMLIAFWGVEDLAGEAGEVGFGEQAPPIALAHNVDSPEEVARVIADAVAAGAEPVRPAGPTEWGGTNGYFADPDGYRWEVAHNAGLTVDPDGTVHLGPAAG